MIKPKNIKKHTGISSKRLAELRRATLIASTGASTRLADSKLSDKESFGGDYPIGTNIVHYPPPEFHI